MIRHLSVIAAASALLVGCANNGTSGEVKLGVDVAPLVASSVSEAGAAAANTDLVIGRIRLLVREVKIGYAGGGGSGGPAAQVGPYVVDLTADEIASGAHRDFSLGTIDAGTYGGAEIEIEPLEGGEDLSDPALADFASTGASVLIDGTYKGAAFQFAGHFLAEQGTDGQVTIDASSPFSLALAVDPSSWLEDADGNFVDPTDTAQHDALALAICETLDTEDGGVAAASTTDASSPALQSQHHGGGKPGGGGGEARCVEATPSAS